MCGCRRARARTLEWTHFVAAMISTNKRVHTHTRSPLANLQHCIDLLPFHTARRHWLILCAIQSADQFESNKNARSECVRLLFMRFCLECFCVFVLEVLGGDTRSQYTKPNAWLCVLVSCDIIIINIYTYIGSYSADICDYILYASRMIIGGRILCSHFCSLLCIELHVA